MSAPMCSLGELRWRCRNAQEGVGRRDLLRPGAAVRLLPEDHESDEDIFSTQVVCISGQSFALAWTPTSIGNFQMEPLGKACQQ